MNDLSDSQRFRVDDIASPDLIASDQSYLLALAVLVTTTALLYARYEYRKRGKLTVFGMLLLCAMLFVPNAIIHYSIDYELSGTPTEWVGVALTILGGTVCLISIIFFRSLAKMLCLDPGRLTVTGPYRFSRNPQYLSYLVFLLGFTLTGWSPWCLAALLVVAISLHLLVLVEEEHLQRVFGQAYAEFCARTPRYLGRARAQP